ncbi:chaplin family protein [Streptomyces sp. NPDC045456]|uniref:chaplin n=1 Tax=Streptomyces sp. NPDC045456 TaxID=3155254 RepID=UPI0033E10CA4
MASRTGVQVSRGPLGTHVHAEEGSRRRCGRGENRSGSGVCGKPCVAFRRTDRLIRCDALSVPARFRHGCTTRTGEPGVRRSGGVPRRRGLSDIPSGCGHLVCTRCPVRHLRRGEGPHVQPLVKHSVLVAATATGILAGAAAGAHADSGAAGRTAAAPGVLAGNLLQAPVHLPVNLCGNTVNVIGLLNPAFANHCANTGSGHRPPGHKPPGHKPPGHKPPDGHQPPGHKPPGHKPPGHKPPDGHQPPGHKPPGNHQPPGHKPPGHKPPGNQPPGHKPPGHEVPGTPGPGGHQPPTDPQRPGHRPPTDVAGEVDSRNPSGATPAGGGGREAGHAVQIPALAHTGSDHLGAAAAASGALLLGGVALVRRGRSPRT